MIFWIPIVILKFDSNFKCNFRFLIDVEDEFKTRLEDEFKTRLHNRLMIENEFIIRCNPVYYS